MSVKGCDVMLYETVMVKLLQESKMDSLANEISRRVMRTIRDAMPTIEATEPAQIPGYANKILSRHYETMWNMPRPEFSLEPNALNPQYAEENKDMDIDIKVDVIKQSTDSAHVNASWGGKRLELKIIVKSTSGMLMGTHLSMIQFHLYDAVRHELEHAAQPVKTKLSAVLAASNMATNPNSIPKTRDYYINMGEKPAFAAGMYNRAKKLRIPVSDVFEERLKQIESGLMKKLKKGEGSEKVTDAIEAIRQAWTKATRERYPKAQF